MRPDVTDVWRPAGFWCGLPILPAIVASGLMMGLVEALGKAMPAFAGSDWYGILDLFANTAFTFLPILIAFSADVVWHT